MERTLHLNNATRVCRWIQCVLLAITALPFAAQPNGKVPEYAQPANPLLRWSAIIVVLVGIWFILYKGIYPLFLRYYRDDLCKMIFWTLLILYGSTWIFLSSYLILEFGFYYVWMHWIAAFLIVLWLISGVVILLRRDQA